MFYKHLHFTFGLICFAFLIARTNCCILQNCNTEDVDYILFVSRALKSVLVDLSLPKRRALFDFLRDPQFVKSKLTYLFLRTAKRPWTDWHGWNSTIILDFGATSIKWVSRHETMSTKTRCVHKDGQIRSLCFFQKCPSLAGEVSSTPILHEIVNRLTRNHQ
jgi:hypothetical protein